jgi:hypothetical protein
MEGEAMAFLNRLGNALCGTKLISRGDYRSVHAWRHDFGDFGPFDDFELLFPARRWGWGSSTSRFAIVPGPMDRPTSGVFETGCCF